MNTGGIYDLLTLVQEYFPLPDDGTFLGAHSFTVQGSNLSLNIWRKCPDGNIRNFPMLLDYNEFVSCDELEEITDMIDAEITRRGWR
jgi:hypothetical protein